MQRGESFLLSIPYDEDGPQTGVIPGRINPNARDDHGQRARSPATRPTSPPATTGSSMGIQAATHWDALAHAGYEGLLYNDTPDTVITDAGAAELGIEHVRPDRHPGRARRRRPRHGVDYFDDGYAITGDDLERRAPAGVTVESGDVLLVRTGQMHWLARATARFDDPSPGLRRRRARVPARQRRRRRRHRHARVRGVARRGPRRRCCPCT